MLTCTACFPVHIQTGKMLLEEKVHEDAIQDLQLAPEGGYAVSASLDKTAKLVDLETFQVLKTYRTGRLVQSAAISPIMDHVRESVVTSLALHFLCFCEEELLVCAGLCLH